MEVAAKPHRQPQRSSEDFEPIQEAVEGWLPRRQLHAPQVRLGELRATLQLSRSRTADAIPGEASSSSVSVDSAKVSAPSAESDRRCCGCSFANASRLPALCTASVRATAHASSESGGLPRYTSSRPPARKAGYASRPRKRSAKSDR